MTEGSRARQSEDQLERARAEVHAASSRLAASAHRIRVLEAQVEELQRRYERLAGRRSVRMALRLAAVAGPVSGPILRLGRRASRRLRSGDRGRARRSRRSPVRQSRSQRSQAEVVEGLRRLRPESGLASGPLVSIVVLTRDGRAHLERLLSSLRDRTAYRSFEVIVVDNASRDRTNEVLLQDWGFPLRVIRNASNVTFSEIGRAHV